MEVGAIVHILGLNCRPDQEEKFNHWYNERHIPDLLKYPDVRRVTRYTLLYPGKTHPGYAEVKYPRYLAVYEFNNQKDYEAYETSPQMTEAMKELRQTWAGDPFERAWRVQYRVLKTWGERKSHEIINFIANQCRPDQEEKFNRWYDETHVPYILKTNCINRAIRFTALFPGKVFPGYPDVKYPKYMAMYEFPNLQSYQAYEASPVLVEAMKELGETWSNDPYEKRWRTQYRIIQEWIK